MKKCGWFFIIVLIYCFSAAQVAAQQRNKLLLTEDHLTLLLDLNSPAAAVDSILRLAGVTHVSANDILKKDYSLLRRDGWMISNLGNNLVQVAIPLSELSENPQARPYQVTKNFITLDERPGYPAEVSFGVNNFSHVSVHELPSGITRFFLAGHLNATRVFLAGNFNQWSTLKSPMTKCDSGWVKDISLSPGLYAYKFIVNGQWMMDPNNNINENDGVGNYNSLYYRYNYVFKLSGFNSAKNVRVSGSFNAFKPDQLNLSKTKNGWERHLYLHEGAYIYRYRVDGKWVTDPANTLKRKDTTGSLFSILNFGQTIQFKLEGHQDAHKVVLSGTFNNWDKNALPMKKENNSWVLRYTLSAGNYDYKFIVDGQAVADLKNPNQSGKGADINSFLAIEPNHVFKLKGYGDAKTIRIAGTFNHWDYDGYTLTRVPDGWQISMYLKPGKYLYKFIVDGDWMLDPGNKLWEQNEFNTGNSVLWIE